MLSRYLPEPLPRKPRAATRVTSAYPENPRSRAVMAIGMLCVPLISFGFIFALYLTLTL
jgi:hypothetical protein